MSEEGNSDLVSRTKVIAAKSLRAASFSLLALTQFPYNTRIYICPHSTRFRTQHSAPRSTQHPASRVYHRSGLAGPLWRTAALAPIREETRVVGDMGTEVWKGKERKPRERKENFRGRMKRKSEKRGGKDSKRQKRETRGG